MDRDAVAGAALAVLGTVALAGAPPRDPVAGVMGPGVLPSLVALGLVLCGLGLVASALRPPTGRRRRGRGAGDATAARGAAAAAGPDPACRARAADGPSVPGRPAAIQADPRPSEAGATDPPAADPPAARAAGVPHRGRVRLLVTALGTTAYAAALPDLGFPLASALFVAGLSWYLGERRVTVAVLWGGLFAAALWAGFVRGLGVPLPLGPLGRP